MEWIKSRIYIDLWEKKFREQDFMTNKGPITELNKTPQ